MKSEWQCHFIFVIQVFIQGKNSSSTSFLSYLTDIDEKQRPIVDLHVSRLVFVSNDINTLSSSIILSDDKNSNVHICRCVTSNNNDKKIML